MNYFYTVIIILCLAGSVNSKNVTPITKDQFAYGFYLDLQGKGAIYSFMLKKEVYEKITKQDLQDIRIFNGNGKVVPFSVQIKNSTENKIEKKLPFFPLYKNNKDNEIEGLTIKVKKDAKGTIIGIKTTDNIDKISEKTYAYLVDSSMLKSAPEKLCFSWQSTKKNFATTVRIDHSNDLANWQVLVKKASLAELDYNNHKFRIYTILLPKSKKKYMRLSWPAGQKEMLLTEVKAIHSTKSSKIKRVWTSVKAKSVISNNKVIFNFDTKAFFPVDAFQIKFNEKNNLLRAVIKTRSNEKSNWIKRFQGLFYNLYIDEITLKNDIVTFNKTTDRFWRIEIDQEGKSMPDDIDAFDFLLGFLPHEILFVARGRPPFLLAYGSSRICKNNLLKTSENMFTRILGTGDDNQLIKKAVILDHVILGGEKMLKPPAPSLPWKVWILWGVLITGVGIIACMVRNLYRQMNAK